MSVNAYGVVDGITYPLMFEIFKPKNRLKQEDKYKTKPQIAIEIIQQLKEWGFKIKLVLADSRMRREWRCNRLLREVTTGVYRSNSLQSWSVDATRKS